MYSFISYENKKLAFSMVVELFSQQPYLVNEPFAITTLRFKKYVELDQVIFIADKNRNVVGAFCYAGLSDTDSFLYKMQQINNFHVKNGQNIWLTDVYYDKDPEILNQAIAKIKAATGAQKINMLQLDVETPSVLEF
jgi:hypothetical protein